MQSQKEIVKKINIYKGLLKNIFKYLLENIFKGLLKNIYKYIQRFKFLKLKT